MAERQQILCSYNGYRREICPVILGHTRGQEKALTFQFGGESVKGLPQGGEWRCLFLVEGPRRQPPRRTMAHGLVPCSTSGMRRGGRSRYQSGKPLWAAPSAL